MSNDGLYHVVMNYDIPYIGFYIISSFIKLGALRSLLRPYLYPNATSPTRVHGGSNTTIYHDTRQSSRGVSVTIVNLVCVGPDEVDIL